KPCDLPRPLTIACAVGTPMSTSCGVRGAPGTRSPTRTPSAPAVASKLTRRDSAPTGANVIARAMKAKGATHLEARVIRTARTLGVGGPLLLLDDDDEAADGGGHRFA